MRSLDPRIIDALTWDRTRQVLLSPTEVERRLRTLSRRDRMLIEMSLRRQLSRRQMAVVMGVSPGTINRRLRRLINLIHDPLVTALTDPTCTLAPDYRQLGIEHFLHRKSHEEMARRHDLTLHEVRTTLAYVRGWFLGISSERR